jgi:conjugative relaxase-like TrwC/TraI family protein
MLRIRVSDNAEQAKAYHIKSASLEAYYSETQEFAGYWGGKGAAMLGLKGWVDEGEAFCRLCDNLHPVTGQQLTARMMANRRVGYDFNFNAPKSVTLAYLYLKDERIMQVYRQAIQMVMEEVEERIAARIRIGDRNLDQDRLTRNMIRAEFVHLTARPEDGIPDPHLHSHVYVFNITWDPVEGKWKAAQLGDIVKKADHFQAMFFSHLSTGLAELGYEIVHKGKWFELAGINRALIEKFSRRSLTINAAARDRGITDAAEKDKLAALTRESKAKHLLIPDLAPIWWDRLTLEDKKALECLQKPLQRLLTFDAPPVRKSSEGLGARRAPDATPLAPGRISRNKATKPVEGFKRDREANDEDRRAVAYALEHLFERKSAVTQEELETEAIYSWGYGRATLSGIRKVIADTPLIRRELDGQKLLTTKAVLAEEDRIIDLCLHGKGRFEPINEFWKFQDEGLTAEQKAAASLVLNSRDFVTGIHGLPGVGKSRLMHELKRGIEAACFKTHILAPWGVTAHDTLKNDGFEDANTIASLLRNKDAQAEARGSALLVDEAGLVSTRVAREFFELAARLDARVILVGDTGQHHPVDRGQAFHLLQKYARMAVAEVTEIQRQKNPEYKAFVEQFAAGETRRAVTSLWSMGAMVEQPLSELAQTLAADYIGVIEKGKSALVVAPTHAECNYVTDAIRDGLKEKNLLGKGVEWETLRSMSLTEPEKSDWERYEKGQVVQFNGHVEGFALGEQVEVIDARDGVVRVRSCENTFHPRIKPLPLSQPEAFGVYERATLEICSGESIRVTGNGRTADRHRLYNGTLHTVDYIAPDGALVLENGWRIGKEFQHLSHGYVLTSHASQGKTVDWVFAFQTAELSSNATNRTQFHVATSRGREGMKAYTDSFEWLQDSVEQERERPMATEILEQAERADESESQGMVKSSASLGMEHEAQAIPMPVAERESQELEMEM